MVREVEINSGVPQGSVLGPTLWNILYNGLLRIDLEGDVKLVGFADDIIMVATAKKEETLMNIVNAGLLRVTKWMEDNQLQLAPHKTEAVLLTTKRKMLPIHFSLCDTVVTPRKAVKYLGVWMDSKLTFAEHVNQTIKKAERTVAALSSLMPNIGGPRASKRRTLASVVHSQLLYGAPAWSAVRYNKKLTLKLLRIQRRISIRVCSAYKTISAEGVGVIAGIPPIDLQTEESLETYTGIDKQTARDNLVNRWQQKWNVGIYGRWTYRLIPDIQTWINRPYGEVDYFLTQALSGHGCFQKYLFERSSKQMQL